jgi:uncharacterized protein
MISKKKILGIVKKIVSFYDPDRIVLFGSYAAGNANEDSDVDLFIVKKSDLPRPQRTLQIRRLLFGSMIPMDILVYTPDEVENSKLNNSGFISEILNNGKILYEKP